MTTQKASIAEITQQLYDLLEPLETDDRSRCISAAQTLLGDARPIQGGVFPLGSQAPANPLNAPSDIRAFFDSKSPQNKGEELAVAARYRELQNQGTTHTREDFDAVIRVGARRNFDSKNFQRDLNNAKTKGLFTKGKEHALAYYGQEYVDALPDREAIKKLRKPKNAGRKNSRKKASVKKKGA